MNLYKEIVKKSIEEKKKNNNNLLNKKYLCLDEVGKGGLSVVYKATDIYSQYFEKDSNIVLKIPTEELLKKDDIAAFVYSEYRFLRRLSSDNIVKVVDFGIDKKEKTPYLVLEYIEGQLLSDLSIVTIEQKTKKNIFRSLIRTLEYIHNKGIIHGDITPSNVIIKNDFSPVIFDFGISQNINNHSKISLEYQKVKAINPKYCAPELLLDNGIPSIPSDIFSLATILYELFSNKPLFEESSNELIKLPINKRDLSCLPFFLKKWFKNALSLNVKDRYL